MYLPKNTTSKIQPMDQGVISTLKQHYRKKLIKDMVSVDQGLLSFLKELTLKDVINKLQVAWDHVKQESVKKCWTRGLGDPFTPQEEDHPDQDSQDDSDDDSDDDFLGFTEQDLQTSMYQQLLEEMQATNTTNINEFTKTWATLEDNIQVAEHRTDEELVQEVQQEEEPEESEEPEEDPVAIQEAIQAAELLVKFFDKEGDAVSMLQQQTLLRNIRMMREKRRRQTTISELFKAM